jgi:hypothetical protein
MRKSVKLGLLIVAAIVFGFGGYFELQVGYLFYHMHSQMKAGQRYMDSITEKDIPVWLERTKNYLKEYNPKSSHIGDYEEDKKPIPDDLKSLKIIRIDILQDSVYYLWLGGMDHTYLEVQKIDEDNFKLIGRYNKYSSMVIWPKEGNGRLNPAPQDGYPRKLE